MYSKSHNIIKVNIKNIYKGEAKCHDLESGFDEPIGPFFDISTNPINKYRSFHET